MFRTEKMAKSAVVLFFALLMLIGLLTIGDYTGSYDETAEQVILSSNMKEYALALQKLGICCEYWLQSDVQPISRSIEKDHGISGYYVYGLLFEQLEGSETLRYTLWSAMTWLWFMAGVGSLYGIARQLGLRRMPACAAALLLYLSPRFFADGHLNNKDVVLLCMMLATLWQGGRVLDKPSVGRVLLFSFVGAMAMNTKIVALMAWAFIMAAMLVKNTLLHQWNRRSAGLYALAVLAFDLFYLALTPAMWQDPMGFFAYLVGNAAAFSRWEGRLFFRGASFQIPENPLPVYYLPYMMLTTLPVYVFPLCLVGQLAALRDALRKPAAFFTGTRGLLLTCATSCWVLALAAFAVLRPVVYNGWRHFYFTFAGVAVLAGYGIGVLWRACQGRAWLRRLCAAAMCLCFGVTAAGMIVNHPRQAAYYNRLAGELQMETDYWNTSGTYALKKLAGLEERNRELPLEVGCFFFDIQNAAFKLDAQTKAMVTTTVRDDSPYLYYIENYVQVYDVKPPEGYHVLFEVNSYGRLIGTMYEKDE